LDLLARREHTRRELSDKLAAKSFDPDVIRAVLDDLEREGLISSGRFAESFVAARAARGQGPVRIARELAERGVESPGDWLDDGRYDWNRLAREVRRKKFGESLPSAFREKARQARFLEYRGFSQDQIRRALGSDDD
jgi:regulatory protein